MAWIRSVVISKRIVAPNVYVAMSSKILRNDTGKLFNTRNHAAFDLRRDPESRLGQESITNGLLTRSSLSFFAKSVARVKKLSEKIDFNAPRDTLGVSFRPFYRQISARRTSINDHVS